jgi:pectin methylesterase-like acyl-CoA thioesterase
MRRRPLLIIAAALCACLGCKTSPPDSAPILQLTASISKTLDEHPTDCEALGKALRPQLAGIDKALSLNLRRLGASAHRIDDTTREALEGFARKFAAANLRCRESAAFKEALAALEGQLDER